ncbi:MAG TPA: dihydrolipoamide acetyltransferase family protein [Puia sp.]|jgi:2-oxoglutarate dehydrogenase E2 component (dihydrolipoamide succinyltransferase)|nr:dihydrolipoamide acetyltransferase family protein [Puia sp.]
MPLVDLVMPKMGESIVEATILKWLKQPGDAVKQDESVLEIATDKVDSEVPSSVEGVLEEILFKVNDVVPVGAVIARVRTGAMADTAAAPVNEPPVTRQEYSARPEARQEPVRPEPAHTAPMTNGHNSASAIPANRFYSPLVLNIAASEGVPLHELENIPGSGNEGRVTKKDILQYVAGRRSGGIIGQGAPTIPVTSFRRVEQDTRPATAPAPSVRETSTPFTVPSGNVEIIEMDRMRRLIADHMVRSKQTSAHVTSFAEADVTNMVHWRDRVKKEFEKREGTKITFTPLFMEAVIHCIRKYPIINSSVEGDKIIIKRDINIGMATALPGGNLIVPVIRQADQLNLVGLTRQVNALADSARQNKLRPEDTQGGTFTLTNVGTFGSLMGTPIINQPQVAILAVGVIKKRPVVLETPEGDSIGIRHMMYLSLSYDHRIVDGSLGASFLTAVAKELESFSADREF